MIDDALTDTDPKADDVQIALFRAATTDRRASFALRLSRSMAELSRRAIREANPELSEQEVALRHLALHHGDELAARVRDRLNEGR